jgi:hypothetical protein
MISPFEYVTVLISIILGMGITQIVSGLANIVHRWGQVRIYWPHLLLVILVFIIHIQEWWVTFELRHYQAWRLPVFLFIILYPVNLYVLARILFPISWRMKTTDLGSFYQKNFKRIYFFMLTLDVLAILNNVFINEIEWQEQIVQFLVMIILIITIWKGMENPWLHKTVVLLLTVITIASLVITWNTFLLPSDY